MYNNVFDKLIEEITVLSRKLAFFLHGRKGCGYNNGLRKHVV